MAIKRRRNKLQDLVASGIVVNNVSGSIPFQYSGPESPLFTISEIPNPVPQGKSSFLIAGTELLKNRIEVKVEIIDSEGGVIYTEPVSNYLEGNARRVSIEVYDDTPPGPAVMYILASVDPDEWEIETGIDVTEFPNPSPLLPRGKKKKKRRKKKRADKQKRGQSIFDDPGRMMIPPGSPFTPPPGNDTRFGSSRTGRRRRGQTSDISDQYNFIQDIKLQIVPTATNTEKIFFYQEPRIKVFEIFKPFVSNIAASGSIVVSGSNLEGTIINTSPGATDNFGSSFDTFRRKRKFKKFASKGGLSKRKRITRRASPEVDNYTFSSATFTFQSNHVGGKIHLDNPQVDSNEFPSSRYNIPTTGSFEIQKVNNSSTIVPDQPFKVYDTQLAQSVEAPIVSSDFSVEFDPDVTQSISITNFRSYADVRVSNIRTFSGDVFRTKVYRKSEESISDYELFADLPLESSELLLNTLEGTGLERTGYFVSQSDAVKYWEVSQSAVGLTGNDATASAKYDIDVQMDSIYLSGSNFNKNESLTFKLKGEYSFTLEENVNYDFSAQLYGVSKPKKVDLELPHGGTVEGIQSKAELEVYISGSNIPAQQGNEEFGAKLGVVRIDDGSPQRDFKITTGDFESTAKSENCRLIFKVNAGKWYVSDISIRPATETGFSPDLFTFTAPMPQNEVRPETYEFLAEFYDVNNNQADAFTFTATGSTFQGSNTVITGQDNVVESNLFIGGETTASGIHLGGVSSQLPETGTAGAAGSGFMRTVGYTGFTSASKQIGIGKYGFMFFSGSVLPDSGDNYAGVGLELVGPSGSFRFRTNPSLFDVRADAFFVGRTGSQFISGSGGDIEISSSDFHLTPEGNVTASALLLGDKPTSFLQFSGTELEVKSETFFVGNAETAFISGSGNKIEVSSSEFHLTPEGNVTASEMLLGDKAGQNFLQFAGGTLTVQGDITVDSIKTPALIGGANSTVANASSSIDANGLATFKSASIAGFEINPIAISSEDKSLILSASGQITGSNVKFTGGKIAAFTLSDDAFTAGDKFFISSSVENDESFFISSSNFQVKASGDMTGSNVLFDGGTIGGFSIGESTIQGGNLILDKNGTIRSANYQSDFAGWLITADLNGFAEFENVKVRGTLSTTTFEKESVNAVGGQLFIANSTALTGSAVLAAHTTMSVVNASGFSNGEILQIKKVTNTGFTTEYVKINSASLDGDLTKDEFHGRVYVDRALTSASSSLSSSVGDGIGGAQDYEPGQVIVSTGKIGTGYIRLNANPNNQATPYIDIVERTGSGVYDVELKARIGDLSGVGGSRNVPLGFQGFGLMSEVAFLSGSQIKLEAPSFLLGDMNKSFVSGSQSKIEISGSAFHLKRDGQLIVGDKDAGKFIEWDNSDLVVRGNLSVDRLFTPATIGGSASNLNNASSSLDENGNARFVGQFFLGKEGKAFVSGARENLEISSSRFQVTRHGDLTLGRSVLSSTTITSANLSSSFYAAGLNFNQSSLWHHLKFDRTSGGATSGNVQDSHVQRDDGVVRSNSGFVVYDDEGDESYTIESSGVIGSHFKNVSTNTAETLFDSTSWPNLGTNGSSVSGDLDNFTIAFWIKPETVNHTIPQAVFTISNNQVRTGGSKAAGLCVYTKEDDITLAVFTDGADASDEKASSTMDGYLTTGAFHHVALSYNSQDRNIKIYHNGVLRRTTALGANPVAQGLSSLGGSGTIATIASINSDSGTKFIGHSDTTVTSAGSDGRNFQGRLDDFRMYINDDSSQVPLTDAQVGNLYGATTGSTFDTFGPAISYTNSNNEVQINTRKFSLGLANQGAVTSNQAFISGSGGKMEISSSNFHLKEDGNVIMSGNVTADSGNIGGWTVGSTLSATNILLDPATPKITLGNKATLTDGNTGAYIGTDGIALGASSVFKVTDAGVVTATSATITGTINANAGNFSGDITSAATITGGTLRTADETVGAGKSVKINGATNTLEFFGDAVAFNSTATDIPTKLFFLDDSNQLDDANSYSKFPGLAFSGFDANSSTFDNATDGGNTTAHDKGGLYIPYTFGQSPYVQFTSMLTGHALGLYRGSLGQQKISTGGDYGQDTPDVYDLAQLSLKQTNGSPSSEHNQDGNPSGYGGTSTYGAGGNNHMFMLQGTNVVSRSNINDRGGSKKAYRAISSGTALRHPSSNGGGYNYQKNIELVGLDTHNRAIDQYQNGFNGSKYYQLTTTSAATQTISLSSGTTQREELDTNWGTTTIDPANGGNGHPVLAQGHGGTFQVAPATDSSTNYTKVEYLGYRIKVNSVSGDDPSTGFTLKLQLRWESVGGTLLKSVTLKNTTVSNVAGGFTESGFVDLRGEELSWAPSRGASLHASLLLTSQAGTSYVLDTGLSSTDSNSSYVYFYGQGDENIRSDDAETYGVRISSPLSGSNVEHRGTEYNGYFGDSNIGYYARIRGADTVYGIYSRVNETGAMFSIKDAQNGQSGGNVYAGYFLGNVHVAGNITFSGTSTQSSDKRLKENIRIVSGSLNLIKQLQTKRFDWKSDYEYEIGPHQEGKKDEIGFIAQDVEKVIPELVIESSLPKRGYDPNLLNTQHPEYKGKKDKDFQKSFKFLNYEKLIPHLVNAMQEQQEQIEDLKREIEELKEK